MIPSNREKRSILRGLDHASRHQICHFAILLSLLTLWSVALHSERPILARSTMAFVAAGLEMVQAFLRRELLNGDPLNHSNVAVAFTGVSSLALGVS